MAKFKFTGGVSKFKDKLVDGIAKRTSIALPRISSVNRKPGERASFGVSDSPLAVYAYGYKRVRRESSGTSHQSRQVQRPRQIACIASIADR
jgi:hypothetical protein